MSARVLCPVMLVLVLVLLMAAPALATSGGWKFNGLTTLDYTYLPDPPENLVDGRFYNNDGSLVKDGTLVQIIIGLDGADIVDPMEHFDTNENGAIDGGEFDDLFDWLWAGADPADISGGTNVLAYGTHAFMGEFATVGGAVDWTPEAGSEPTISNGYVHDKIAWRAWSQPKEVLEAWNDPLNYPELVGLELWYTAGREFFAHDNAGGGPDTAWWIGMPDLTETDPITMWGGFDMSIGSEVYAYYVDGQPTARSQNKMDHYLGYFTPEPDALWLVGCGLLLLAARRARNRARAAVE